MNSVPARVFLRPIGSPLTVGMSGLVVASIVESGYDLGWIPKAQGLDVGLILLAVPFVLQLLATIFSYLARDGATGAATGVLATSWLALGLLHVASPKGHTSGAFGLMLLSSGGVLALSAVAVCSAKPLPGCVFLLAGLRFALAGVYELSVAGVWQDVAGIVGLFVAAVAAYCVLAFELEGQQHRPVLPTLRRGRGAVAVGDDVAGQLDGIAREAGVRQTS
jgi:uncharacterized protein